jgi:hypothetical protein
MPTPIHNDAEHFTGPKITLLKLVCERLSENLDMVANPYLFTLFVHCNVLTDSRFGPNPIVSLRLLITGERPGISGKAVVCKRDHKEEYVKGLPANKNEEHAFSLQLMKDSDGKIEEMAESVIVGCGIGFLCNEYEYIIEREKERVL